MEQERQEIIDCLKQHASEVKKLKETHRKRRPIVIEFSGSPKAGKTSCINSLRQFLKRNGFEVEIIQERASVCPVSDKRSPMFNVWTSCMSLAGLIGIIEDKKSTCDVIILDRGIFDALCWFEWLTSEGKMEKDFREKVQDFLLSSSLVGMIDIVFSFTVEPEKSIEREYANLLTDQIGSIMNLKVLDEYRRAIDKTVKAKKKYFGSVIPIDTTYNPQDKVGNIVTTKTLETLSELLDEKIGYISVDEELREILNRNRVGKTDILKKYLLNLKFEKRLDVENNKNKMQPIPILVLSDYSNEKIFVVKKKSESISGSSTEKNKLLLYVGGHTRKEDVLNGRRCDYLQTCRDALQREVKEELGISIALGEREPIYIVGVGENEEYHIAICYKYEIETEGLKLRLDSHELTQNKGSSKSGKFLPISEILDNKDELESWSVAILKHFFSVEVETPRQMSLFE
ncbi:MAG: NUDIX hydrolase [Agathobacter sp.]|nr:NUDIX hydrolase [Agathobacter sp.]